MTLLAEWAPMAGGRMSSGPLVSVIVIFLDEEAFLEEAIGSVMAQTYENWELLLVDDGSTDRSPEMAKQYAARYAARIRYLEHAAHENRGTSASRNLGIAHSRGELVAFLDADDVLLPDKLERQVATIEAHPDVDVVVNRAFRWFGDGSRVPQGMTLSPGRLPPGAWIPKILESDTNGACTSGVLIKRSRLISVGGFEESFPSLFDDQVLWCKIGLVASIYYDPVCVALYRIHPACSCVATPHERRVVERVRFYSWLERFLSRSPRAERRSGLLSVMVRCNLLNTLMSPENWRSGGRRSRFRVLAGSAGAHAGSLGYFFSGLLLFGAVSRRAALAVSRGICALCQTAYTRLPATLAFPRRLYAGARSVVFGLAKRAVRLLLDVTALPRARARLAVGVRPLSQVWGLDRGTPIHRYYLESFLQEFSSDIRGRCLEFQEDNYASRFGGENVTRLDILHKEEGNPKATIVADLTTPNTIPSESFDCIICTHVLHMIPDLEKSVVELRRILKPGGVLLAAVPHVSMCDPKYHEVWRFTPEGLHCVLTRAFRPDDVTVRALGNSLTAAGELRGLVIREFTKSELDYHDPRFAVEVCARAVKQGAHAEAGA